MSPLGRTLEDIRRTSAVVNRSVGLAPSPAPSPAAEAKRARLSSSSSMPNLSPLEPPPSHQDLARNDSLGRYRIRAEMQEDDWWAREALALFAPDEPVSHRPASHAEAQGGRGVAAMEEVIDVDDDDDDDDGSERTDAGDSEFTPPEDPGVQSEG
jgi:hypothetical protein